MHEQFNHTNIALPTDLYMVMNIDVNQVVKYTKSHLPEDWKRTENRLVKWEVSSGRHPPLSWLQEFWRFLNSHIKELSSVNELPLIPVNPVPTSQSLTLAKIQKKTTLIFKKTKQLDLPQHMAQLVNKVGGTVVTENNWLKHEDLDSYVLSPSPQNVLKVFVNLHSQQVIKELKSLPKSALEELKDYFSCLDSLSNCKKELLLKLPLFQTMKGEYTTAQSKQAVLINSGIPIPTDLPMPDSVVKCATEADRRLLQLLQTNLLDTAQAASLLIDSVERRACSKADTEKIMTWVLDHGNILFSQNQTLKSRCTNVPFIEIRGELKKASSLFDPRVNAFKVIFEDDFFPPALYTKTSQMLASLTDLGLINKELDAAPKHLLHAATLIEKLSGSNPKEAQKRAQVLLKMLDANDLLESFTSDQLEQLKMLKWVPWSKPENDNQSASIESGFFSPKEMRHSIYDDIVGYVMPLEGKLNDKVCRKLDLKRQPPPEKVVENLSVLMSKVEKLDNPDTNVDFKRKLRNIYGHMEKSISEFSTLISKDTAWLWNRNHFVAPHKLVLDYPNNLDLSSHVGKVPDEFLPYKNLFLEFGLREELTDKEIVDLLYIIKLTVEGREPAVATPSEVKLSIEILNWLWREKKVFQDDIPVPVIVQHGHYTLKPRSMTVFCDLSKNGLKELECSQEEIHVVHEEIPLTTAEYLDIQLLSTYILDPKSVGIEQCGQTEPITTRIKNILKEYDEESDIFKEIIQNAEDAGAQTCKFLMDFRFHRVDPERLIDPDMTLCQGPCVWAFNNEQFSHDDWDNIVRVGSASKENQAEKIGKFGLGFNTVYHVTDIPSILSGNTLLILDPNITHLKKRIKHKSNPGIKLDLSQKRLFHWFPGQFESFQGIFNCSFSSKTTQHYPGTLIKLPFRTAEEALSSEISTKVYSNQDIGNFQQHFTRDSQSHLIFLKNINTVSLQTIPNFSSTPLRDSDIEDIFTVSKTTVRTMSIPEETGVSMQHHAEELLMKLNSKCKEVINCSKVDIVEITCEQSGETQVQNWLLYNCFGTNQSLKMAMKENKKVSFSLPIGGVAVPLEMNPETEKFMTSQTKVIGQAFCFLPLSIHTGLPVNVNGTFAVTSNRKGLWESGVKHEWNRALLQDPLVTAYVTALLVLKEMSEKGHLENYCYHTFWPDRELVSETFKPLVDAFYFAIAQASVAPHLFSDGEHWCSMENAIFLHESIEEDQNICALAMQVCQKHVNSNHVVPVPVWVRNSFKQTGLGKVLQDRTWNWEKFYQEAVFENLSQLDPQWRDTLVLYAIDLNMKEIDNLLVSYPCIPTTSGQLQFIRNLVNPSGKVACLFEHEEGRLLGGTHNDFCSHERMLRLQMLGMASDELSLEDITKKAKTISNTWNNNQGKAYVHLKCLLELLKCHMHKELSPYLETLRATEFMPAFTPGDAKMERVVTLQRPNTVFTDKCALLVNMTQPVLDLSNLKVHPSDPVLLMLGVNESPRCEMVLEQLKEAQKHCQSLDKLVLHKIANECYRFLDHRLCCSDDSTTKVILQSVKSFPFVLVGDQFVNVNCVAEMAKFEAKPYLHVLPPQFTNFRSLWEKVGVEKGFTIKQCLAALRELYSKHGNKPLPKNDLSICLTILNRGIYESEQKTNDCLVPNKKGVLQPAQKLFYNDSPWMPVTKGVTLCHENISRVMALHFGIKTTRHHTLTNSTVEMSPFAFQFEQQEQLTVRIKNIISAYPAKKDILKELIQNADDAEATEINFIWDKRQHSSKKTFGEKWNALQGPALCVFNNKVFSDADLAGIQQLGEGGKHNSPGKTGKYGLGFNSVYHLSDCPSILTGDKLLCISDPNQNYIESTSDVPPAGIGYKLPDSFKQMYMDVYNAFLPDKFPLKEGTMFRLPLRTGSMADISKISREIVTDRDMEQLCSALSEDPEGLILFLKSICRIQVHEIDTSGNLRLIFAVEKSVPDSSVQQKDAFVKCKQHALQSDKQVIPQKVIYGTVISTSHKRKTKWIVAEQFGSFKKRDDKQKTPTDKLPQAAIAAQVSLKNSDHESKSKTHFVGEAFCSLPLPGNTGLPVHVNANFEVDSSRRNLWKEDGQSQKINWNESLKQAVIAPLYADLLEYLHCSFADKKDLKTKIEKCLTDSFLCFFPSVANEVNPDWHEMIHEVYRSIKERGLNVIPVFKSSTQTTANRIFKEYSFDWCNISETEPTKVLYLTTVSEKMNTILEDVGMKLVPASMAKIWTSFKSAGIELKKVTPSTVQTFLRAKPLNDPAQTEKDLPLPITQTLIKNEESFSELLGFCLKDLQIHPHKDTKVDPSLLNGLPLLLTKDKVLRVFNFNSPKLASAYDSLFTGYEDQFADFKTNRDFIGTLETFGFVRKLTLPNAENYLKPLIQHFLKTCEVDPENGQYTPNEEKLPWLKSLWKFIISQIEPASMNSDKDSLTLGAVKQLYSESCILPAVCPRLNNKKYLRTMKDMSSVIQFASKDDSSSILFKLGFMKLDTNFFLEMDRALRSPLSSELMKVNNKSSVLDQLYNIKSSEFSQLSSGEMNELQGFLNSGVSKAENKQDYKRKFKSLPLFETVKGERVRIDGPQQIFVLNMISMMRFPDLFTLPDTNAIFLKYNPENMQLSQTLGLQTLDDLDYLVKFILPVVHKLTEHQTLHCLKLLLSVQHQYNYSNSKDKIISSFETVKLIRSSLGKMEMVSYYFDDYVELFKLMLPNERFVPKTFLTELCEGNILGIIESQNLLRDLGMKHKVSTDDIITFAQQVEREAKGNCQMTELKKKSSLIFSEALQYVQNNGNKDKSLLKRIADIKFIFPEKIKTELCNYHPPFTTDSATVQIRGAFIQSEEHHQELIWSSMPIIHLPVYKSPNLLQLLRNVGAFEKLPPEYVTKNMSNICQSPCQNEETIRTRANVFKRCYAFLQTDCITSQSLAGLPVVLVEKNKRLVRTEDVAISLYCDNDFRPYLYKIPPELGIYELFFQKIGVKNEPTAAQFCNVLAAVHDETCDKAELQPNQQKTVKRAVQQLFRLIKKGKQSLDDVETLYLPAVNGKLMESCKLYYNDTLFEIERLEKALPKKYVLLEKLSSCHLGKDIYQHHKLLKLLPQKLQPQMLSQITEEKVLETQMELCERNCQFSGFFTEQLSSSAIRHGLICLIRAQSEGKVTQEEAMEMCDTTFGRIQIICCESLQTELWLNKQQLPDTTAETEVYVKQEQQGCIFYLRHNGDEAQVEKMEVCLTLAKEINCLLGTRLEPHTLMVLSHLLLCENLAKVQKILAKNRIRDSVEAESLLFNPPAPGTEIPAKWHDALDMSILNNFEEGEYVGYYANKKYIYAVIVEELSAHSVQLTQRYRIDIGQDEPIEVSFLDLYQFKREKQQPPSSCWELKLVEGDVPQCSEPSTRSSPDSVEEAKKEIDKCLANIWTLPPEERKKAVKRMYLRWHPDKNPDCPLIATEAFKYLQNRIDELTNGKGKSTGTNSSPSYSRGHTDFRGFFHEWNEEARHHRTSRERFSTGHRSYNFWGSNKNIPRPNKEEAKRWCRQARCDLNAAYKDTGGGSTEWCLFKVHQTVEKSLTAASYRNNGKQPNSSSISAMASKVSCYSPHLRGLPQLVIELIELGVDPRKTQYPNYHQFPNIPNGQFRSVNETRALDKASEILTQVEAYVNH